MMMKKPLIMKLALALLLPVSLLAMPAALAAGGGTKKVKDIEWSFEGPFGEYDKAAVQRGFQVYKQVCASCHSLKFVAFRHLGQEGGPFYVKKCPAGFPDNIDCSNPMENPAVKAIAAEYEITDGPDDSGDMFKRPGIPADYFPSPYPNDKIAIMANGVVPPDLSLMAKARSGGPDYIYSLLTGYEEVADYVQLDPGVYYNPYFPGDLSSAIKPEFLDEEGHLKDGLHVPLGGVLKMKAPLMDNMIEYADETIPATVDQYARDVAEFLMWTAEPRLESRKETGLIVLIYLIIFGGIVYASYRQLWSKVD